MSNTEIAKLETRWRENPHGLTFAPLAEAYRKQREPARALEVLAEGLARHPDYIPASIVLGRCHLDLGDDARAEGAFLRVLELDDENVIALKALADISERQGKPADAAGRLRTLLRVDRSNDEARAQLARMEAAASAPIEEAAPAASTAPYEAAEAEELSPADFVWDEPAPAAEESSPAADLLLEDNLRPTGDVAPLPDIVLEEPAPFDAGSESAPAMPGLVGEDFPEHRAGVVPLADLAPGTAAIGEHAPSFNADDDRDIAHEPIGELERSAEIELNPSGTGEFQVESISDEWAAGSLSAAGSEEAGVEPAPEPEPEPIDLSTGERDIEPDSAVEAPVAAFSSADEPPFERDDSDEEYESDDEEPVRQPLPDDLVVTESMAELFLRQGHRAEALLVYRELYHRNRDDLRLREKVDSLETALAAEEAASPRGRSFAAPEPRRSVASFLSAIFAARPGEAPSTWTAAPVPAAPAPATAEAASETGDAAPTRPASDHLSLSDVFGDTGSPVPPAVAATAGAPNDDGVSFDAFFGEAAGAQARPRGTSRDDEDLDQFHAWLQNLKR